MRSAGYTCGYTMKEGTLAMTKPLTAQKIYAVLRKAGHTAAKWESSGMVRGWGDWSPGVRVVRDSDTYKIWFSVSYKVSGAHATERSLNVMQNYIIPVLKAAGLDGAEFDNGLIYIIDA